MALVSGERLEQVGPPDRAERPAAEPRHAPPPSTAALSSAHGPAAGSTPAREPASAAALGALPIAQLQHAAGNAAVAQLLGAVPRSTGDSATRSPLPVQRQPNGPESGTGTGPGTPPGPGGTPSHPPTGTEQLPEGFSAMSDEEKAAAIQGILGSAPSHVISLAWGQIGDPLGIARTNPELFTASLEKASGIASLAPFAALEGQFKDAVESKAMDYLVINKRLVQAERDRTGAVNTGQTEEERADILGGKGSSTETDLEVEGAQRAAETMEGIKTRKETCLAIEVGYRDVHVPFVGTQKGPVKFTPGAPPPNDNQSGPTYTTVMDRWSDLILGESKIVQQHPSAAYFIGEGGDPSKIKADKDVRTARAEIAKALTELDGRIDKAIPKIGHGVGFTDLVPIQQELLRGPAWSKPVESAIARQAVRDADLAKLLETLGISTLSAAAFLFASFATGGVATFLLAAGAGISGGQAAASWDKAFDLAAANKASIDPARQLVSGEQVDDAMLNAFLDTVFAAIDGWQGYKGLGEAAKAAAAARKGSPLMQGGAAGAAASSAFALKNLGSATNKADVLARAIADLGPEEAQRLSGRSYAELAKMAGEETPLGKRLALLGKPGAAALSEETQALIAQLPNLPAITDGAEAERVLAAGLEQFGHIGVLRKVGYWAAIEKTPAMSGPSGKALEAWRTGITRKADKYLEEASEGLSKLERTGTKEGTSDLDMQVLGGAAGELKQMVDGYVAGLLGTDVKEAEKLLHMTVYVDPTRAHIIDVMRKADLSEDVRAAIRAQTAAQEPPLIFGARLKAAEAIADPATKKKAVEEVKEAARQAGVEPNLKFNILTPAEQKVYATKIDGWVLELKEGRGDKAQLVREISTAQALIDASHTDAYVGGGVAHWVTGREGDVEAIAKFYNVDPAELGKVTTARRISAALSEGMWIERAVNRLRVPAGASLEELRKSVYDIGQHGARAADVLQVEGTTDVGSLQALMSEIVRYKKLPAAELKTIVLGGRLPELEREISGILGRLNSATGAAVRKLAEELPKITTEPDHLLQFQAWIRWTGVYAGVTERAKSAVFIELRAVEEAVRNADGEATREEAPAEPAAPSPPQQSQQPAPWEEPQSIPP